MSIRLFCLLMALLTFSHVTYARTFAGDGYVVFCPQNQASPQFQFLGFYEGLYFRDWLYDYNTRASIDDIVARLATRILDVELREYLLRRVDWFLRVVRIQDDVHGISYGLGPVMLPRNCELRVAAGRLRLGDGHIPVIDQDIWSHLDNLDKTGLILHEIILIDALNFGHTNTQITRYLVSWLFSMQVPTRESLQAFFEEKGFHYTSEYYARMAAAQ